MAVGTLNLRMLKQRAGKPVANSLVIGGTRMRSFIEEIDHSRAKTKCPETTGSASGFHRQAP